MAVTTVHIINHTHWDREWFLTSTYTSRWIPGLIDRLERLAADNPGYRFLLDGQTLVIEDLLALEPAYAARVQRLVDAGNLIIGPYYCQPDWQLASGELLIRNLLYGQKDMGQYRGSTTTGWLVDTFGHISQAPQIHRLFGIDSVFVWRGAPRLEPYFWWQGSDGSRLLAINLFGGYRNLYGVSHVPEVATARLLAEVEKLRPYYPTPHLPLFDGYDLDDKPEDPIRFYAQREPVAGVVLQQSTPAAFATEVATEVATSVATSVARQGLPLPLLAGELNSGKYGATFPGTLSARTYLKILAHDCESHLFQVVEPLAVLASLQGAPYDAQKLERWGRLLLQNAVHDCLCGVSIDQVHQKMEHLYREVDAGMAAAVQRSLATIFHPFAPGLYALNTNPFPLEQWQPVGDHLFHIQCDGLGVWPVEQPAALKQVERTVEAFSWQNAHYAATVGSDGVVRVGEATLGRLLLFAEEGDTYSVESGSLLGQIQPTAPLTIERENEQYCCLRFEGAWQNDTLAVSVTVRLHFDPSPLLRWQVDLDSRGANLRVEMVFATAIAGKWVAGMPFDVVPRPVADDDLLPRHVPPALANVLLGQRELNRVSTFPFQDFVAVAGEEASMAVLAKGLHAYSADNAGTLTLTLRRSVEWLTKADLQSRVGDAGPFFYVPDARCARPVRHELAVLLQPLPPHSLALPQINAAYQNPPLIVRAGGQGHQTQGCWLRESLPLSSLQVDNDGVLARFYNPTPQTHPLSQSYPLSDVWGAPLGRVSQVGPGQVVTLRLPLHPLSQEAETCPVELLTPWAWRVGPNAGRPDPLILAQLAEKSAALQDQVTTLESQLPGKPGSERLRQLHQIYILKREQLELHLSLLLNRRKLAEGDDPSPTTLYEPDAEIAEVGLALNRMRIKRRIFDYVEATLSSTWPTTPPGPADG